MVAVEGELEMLAALTRTYPGAQWGRILFSAKESIYKAWYPLTGRWLGFEDVRLMLHPAGNFEAKLSNSGSRAQDGPPLPEFRGRFMMTRDLISTAVTVPPDKLHRSRTNTPRGSLHGDDAT